ncbi:hypothetical protein SHKM778_73470 [Streptomyces sp. KM77-8]|uniref:Uncharacterized protein n=1 Tax=Streptomyces haneummycinicus TaxID=3074435 RepID=A0AAT9HTQ2_9ACTN
MRLPEVSRRKRSSSRSAIWRGEHPQPGGGEFDGERESVEAAADLRAGRRRIGVGVGAEAGAGGGSAVGEQTQRDRFGQRLDRAEQLAAHTERFAAGGEDGEPGAAFQQRLDEVGGGLDDMLAVVQDQQHAARAAVFGEAFHGVGVPVGDGPHALGSGAVQHGLAGADGGEDGLRDGVGVVDRGEFGQPHPVGHGLPYGLGGLLGQPGLARAAGPEQGDEPGGGEVRADGLDVGLPADERGQPGPQIAGRRRRPGCGRRLGPQQLGVQGAQFGAGVGAEAVREETPYVLVGGQGLGGAAGVAQGAQPERLEGFVEG